MVRIKMTINNVLETAMEEDIPLIIVGDNSDILKEIDFKKEILFINNEDEEIEKSLLRGEIESSIFFIENNMFEKISSLEEVENYIIFEV